MLKMDLEYKSGVLFIRLEGNLTSRNNYKINNYIVPVLKKHKIKYVIYNLSGLKNIDESSIDAILKTKCQIKKNKGVIYLCGVKNELLYKIKRLKIRKFDDELAALKIIEVKM